MEKGEDNLFIEERQDKIVKYIEKVEKATIEDIMSLLKISRSTVRRDLMDLERKNLIIKTRGGALKKFFFKYEPSIEEKKVLNLDKKRNIALTAKNYIKEGDVIFISGGTTTLELAKLLYDYSNLIVFTNAINILLELAQNKNIKIRILGGNFRRKTLSAVGLETISQMQNYNFNKSFMGANGVSLEAGVTTPNELEARIDREVIKRSRESFLLVDDTKFDSVAFSVICKLNEVDYVITNREIEDSIRKKYIDKGIKLIY